MPALVHRLNELQPTIKLIHPQTMKSTVEQAASLIVEKTADSLSHYALQYILWYAIFVSQIGKSR